ncbi:MAG TPA: VCBS repeat-containing protein [Flavisolibacter sp.]|nr:VCBS repeat-containing protein [Flavisolibacter sp.]
MKHWGIKILFVLIYSQPCLESTAQTSASEKRAISVHFVPQKIASESFESVGVFDVNGDGKPDLVSGSFWYEGPSFVTRHYIGDVKRYGEYWDDFSTIPLDVNGDGRLDFITGSWWSGSLRWMKNPGKDTAWTEHIIAKTGAIETTRGWDVDGDGTIEICPNNPGTKLKFYKLGKGASGNGNSTFTEVIVADKQDHGLGFGDINGDGRGDFVISTGWLEAPKDPLTQKWSFHDEFVLGSASIPITVADINKDGLNDLIVGQAHDYGLYWYEQKKGTASKRNWVKHPIDPFASQYHTHE